MGLESALYPTLNVQYCFLGAGFVFIFLKLRYSLTQIKTVDMLVLHWITSNVILSDSQAVF